MHICDHHIKVYYNIEKRKLVKIEIEIYRGGQKWTSTGMYIFPICKSLTSKFFIEIDHNTILIICVDLRSCLLNVECYFLCFFQVTPKISFFVMEMQRVREMFIA